LIASGFVGRERELGLLRGLLESARAGKGGVELLVGEPGIGKTRTASVLYPSVLAALRQGLSFRAGLTAVNDASPPERRAEVASSFFVIAYVAIPGRPTVAGPVASGSAARIVVLGRRDRRRGRDDGGGKCSAHWILSRATGDGRRATFAVMVVAESARGHRPDAGCSGSAVAGNGMTRASSRPVVRKRQISTCRPMTAVRSWGSRKCSTELAALWAIAR
jgi:hypothetical protein